MRPVCTSALTDAQAQNDLVSSDPQASPALSDVLARLECELNQLQFTIQTPKARAAALATVNQDIDAAKRLILSMLSRRNMLVPISIPPAGILARIFHFTVFSGKPDSLGLELVTHVCRRWRQIALDNSTFWAEDWIAEQLSRLCPGIESARTTLNTDHMMKSVAQRHQTQTQNESLTIPTTTGTGSEIIAPHETNTQALLTLSDVFSRLECELNGFQSAIQTPAARAAALATADQDIDAARRLILSMLTRRNVLVPISILPAEILARIFHIIVFSVWPSVWPHWLGLRHVTHVCRRWRQTALDDSTLWTHFSSFPQNKDWIVEQLSRVRNAPLVIELDGLSGKDMSSLFIPHISHTRELYLRNLSSFCPEIVQEINIQEAPVLESLELEPSPYAPMSKPNSFFKGPLPKLRILCLRRIVFPWSLVPRGQLTQLKVTLLKEVSTATSKDSQHDDSKQLIGLLVDSPSLEVLTLDNCLPAMFSKSSGGQTIHLPRLSQLCLGGSSSRVTNLLKMLKLPSSTTLRLTCTSEDTATHKDYHILPFLSAHFNDPTPVKFRSFWIDLFHGLGGRSSMISMVASTLPTYPIYHGDVIEGDELSLTFYGITQLNGADILRRACDVLSLSNVEFLAMNSDILNQFISWSEVFQHCTEVTAVEVSEYGTIGLLQALTPPKWANTAAHGRRQERKCGVNDRSAQAQAPNDDENYAPAPVQVPIFPKLTSLRLESLVFGNLVPGSGVLFDLVLNAVQRRKMNKTPLTTLRIDGCVIREKQVKMLEKLVRDFWWDGDDGFNEGYYNDHPEDYLSSYGNDHSDISDPGVWQEAAHVSLAQAE